jgi:hypothetical protein
MTVYPKRLFVILISQFEGSVCHISICDTTVPFSANIPWNANPLVVTVSSEKRKKQNTKLSPDLKRTNLFALSRCVIKWAVN